MKDVDPITAEVIRCGLVTIANEMGDTMIRTATTPTFSESHDFSTAIFDGQGRIVALADALPIHMGASKFSVMAALKDFGNDLHTGDIVVVNDPYHGGSHLPDWTMMTPIFFDGQIIFFPVTRAHQGDTGGAVPGGYNPAATDIWQEGLRLPPIKIYDRGKPRSDIIKMLQINNREPTFLGDLKAMMGSVRVAERRLLEMVKKYGAQTVLDCMDYIIGYTERRFRAEISEWPDGIYKGEAYLEHDCQGVQDITVRVTVTVSGDSLKLDYTGSDPQTPGFINSSVPNSYSYIFLTLSSMIDDSIPRNEGLFNPIEILLPEGTVVNPRPPAPCTACTLHAGGEVGEALAFALEKAIPTKAFVQNIKLGMPLVTYGTNPYSGEFYVDQNVTMAAGWCNAAHRTDGWGAMAPFFGAMTMATGELHDMYFPVQTIEREYIPDSGGPGKWRGGCGTRLRLKPLAPMFLHTYAIGTKYPMRGFNGGLDGSPNKYVIREGTPNEMRVETTAFEEPLSSGHIVRAELGGGGGWGDPLERDPAAVLEDVLDEYVSFEGARRDYGVVIDPAAMPDMKVNERETRALREKLSRERAAKRKEKASAVKYLSPQWQRLCQDAINNDPEFARLAGDLSIELNNIIENCPDGETRFLYWRFENGKLKETVVGLPDEIGERRPFFTTLATYETFMRINTAKTSVEAAVMDGLLRFEGDLVHMMQYADALNRFTEIRRTIRTEY
ncbi:MAG: hydantoinase B/oxoprolinase family protein [Candidatus Abyssobacteria bacterium SURF_17]|uniref:Hydantoinase B/oxoprolinase family protein n=1 Tax=Candidatus Abyssobacteria bacterium SURF_17 TaxID=2093361 RepID=A0A419F0M2_9BACT|nr:MAG: hydantoinase B/oxoprolinase family protein [Candidatus Abyssubacteria bacterium SURF_17]